MGTKFPLALALAHSQGMSRFRNVHVLRYFDQSRKLLEAISVHPVQLTDRLSKNGVDRTAGAVQNTNDS
jgi:hypothetical protein